MRLKVDIDGLKKFDRTTRLLFADQIPFAMSRAINDTGGDAQKHQQDHMRGIFQVRRSRFVISGVKRKPFANYRRQRVPHTIIRFDPPGGRSRSDIITKFESNTRKTARDGGRIAIPTDAVRTGRGNIRKGRRPRDFGFELVGVSGRAAVYRGKSGTFMIKKSDGTGGIYKRGRRKSQRRRRMASSLSTRNVRDDNIQTLYRFRWAVEIRPELEFVENIATRVVKRFPRNMRRRFAQAVKTAR